MATWFAGGADAQQKEILIGSQCDRTGPTQLVGTVFCPAVQDYVNLINSKGGVDGYKVVINELDNNYQVPPAIEEYERHKQEGMVSTLIWGTPQAEALNPRLEKDHIPGTSPGFGSAAAANGAKYPYLFPLAATYWSQGAAGIQFVKDKLGGSLKGKKIAYLYYDNPAGLEPLPILKELQQNEGFELRTFAVPPPGVEMSAQILDISQRYRPDFVLAHLFGRSPSVMIKGLKSSGYPLSKVLGFVWASSEADIAAAGGWGVAQGYHTMQFVGVGADYPVIKEIKAMYQKAGKPPPKEMETSVYYNRGIQDAAVHIEALRNALKLTGGKPPTGEDMKKGFEMIKDFTLGGLLPPMEVTPSDHEGGGWVQIFQVKGDKMVKETEWFQRLSRPGAEVRQRGIVATPVRAPRDPLPCRLTTRGIASSLCSAQGMPWAAGHMLSLSNVEVVYDGVILVLKGVSLTVGQGQITTLLGANGAGKTTTLKAISGLLHAERGQITKGTIELDGERLDRLPPHDIVRRGVTQVFEGRRVFENLTVEENLVVGGHTQGSMQRVRGRSNWSTNTSRSCGNAAASRPAISRAASSRCWRSAARWCRSRR